MGKQKRDYLDPEGARTRFIDDFGALAKKVTGALREQLDKRERERLAEEFMIKHPKQKRG